MRILVAEHDLALGAYLEKEFEAENYSVDLAPGAEQVKSMVQDHDYDAAILDINLPLQDGFEVLRQVRARCERLPILILASGARPGERAQALDLGADDFLLKPFAFSELSARVRALLRRGGHQADAILRVDNLEVSRVEHVVKRAGRKINLTPKEFALLEYLVRNAGQHVTRSEIMQHVWHLSDTMTNIVDVYINYLRKKVDAPSECKLIHTVRGVGYQLQPRSRSGGRAA